MASRLLPSTLSLGLALSITSACTGKGPEDQPFDDYEEKSDSFRKPTEHGTLIFGIAQPAELTADEHFHAWDFELGDRADVTLTTELVTANLDTVMYLYKLDPATGRFGAFKFKNDDASDDTVASEIAEDLDAGHYRVLVKGFKTALRGTFEIVGACDGPGCEVGVCAGAGFEPLPASDAPSCGELVSAALDGTTLNENGLEIGLEERCSLPEAVRDGVEYYHSYWDDIVGFDDQFDFGDGVSLDVDWIELSNGATFVGVDAGGDEAAMDFLINADGELVAHYQHNQSPDFNLYCEGGVGFDLEECGRVYLRSMLHPAADERSGEVTVTAADAATRLDRAALQAYLEYARVEGLGTDDEVTVEFTTWENPFASSSWDTAGRVTARAQGHEPTSYELAAASTTQWQFTVKKGLGDREFECREL